MADMQVPHARKGILERNKWILFAATSCMMVFTTLWLIFMHVNHEGLLYPHDRSLKRIPSHWLHRAVAYNTFTNASNYEYKSLPAFSQSDQPPTSFKLVCYYNFPSEGSRVRRLYAPDIESDLCTHINIAFGTVVNNSVYISESQLKVAAQVIDLKKNNSGLKVLLSVGGAGNGNGYPDMVVNHENRKTFIKSILDLVRDHKFDGIDLDWEFPEENTVPDGKQRMHFTQLLHEIRNEINRQEKHKFLLTLAVAAPIFIVDNSYDVSYMNDYVDFVNVMSYDYHFYTKITPFTGVNSALYATDSDGGYFSTLNINYTANYWLFKGMDRSKIVLGLPTYGHSFRLINPTNNGIGAPANGYGSLGLFGFVGYNELCIFLTKNQIAPIFDMPTRSPYATRNHEWISFDDSESLSYKAEYIRNNNFGGAMVYALNTDDHLGSCADKIRFPLTRKIKETLETTAEL